jgi:hypothetical protein
MSDTYFSSPDLKPLPAWSAPGSAMELALQKKLGALRLVTQ